MSAMVPTVGPAPVGRLEHDGHNGDVRLVQLPQQRRVQRVWIKRLGVAVGDNHQS